MGATTRTSIILSLSALLTVFLWRSTSIGTSLPTSLPPEFTQAYLDTHTITIRPHPYNSHANDQVRDFILARVRSITSGIPFAQVDDVVTPVMFFNEKEGVYFEGNNVLVKVEGTEPELGGVLFSAHFDSVSTAPGVTDNAIAVSSLLALLQHLMTHQPRRTAVFNWNNGEEDGLNGAHSFLEHPWANLTQSFLNLEGAGAGGKPLLFRSTSLAPVKHYTSPSPHGTVISADAFLRGVVRSRTDFSVYMCGLDKQMEGLDIAFYTARAFYHTTHDSLRGAEGARESLWNMMQTVHETGLRMLDATASGDEVTGGNKEESNEGPVYFDVLGRYFVSFTQDTLFKISTSLVCLGPILLYFNSATERKSNTSTRAWLWFWGSVLLTLITQSALVFGMIRVNPYIVHAHPYTYLTSVLSLAYLTTIPTLTRSAMNDKSIWKHLYIFTYMINALAAYAVWKVHIGGVFFLVAGHVGCVLGLVLEGLTGNGSSSATGKNSISSPKKSTKSRKRKPTAALEKAEKSTWLWTLQALLSIPIPTVLVSQVLILFLASLGQTLTDGSSPIFVYASTSILSLLLTIPLTPFSTRLHPNLGLITSLIFVISTLYNLLVFPFSVDAPMKVFFQQKVEITPSGVKAITELTGVPGYLHMLVHEIPSTWGREVDCKEDKERSRTWTCSWESDLIPSVSGALVNGDTIQWNYTGKEGIGRFWFRGEDTRSCKIYFDGRKVERFGVVGKEEVDVQVGYEIPPGGVESLRVFNVQRGEEVGVDLVWSPTPTTTSSASQSNGDATFEESDDKLRGRIACQYSEYESATRGTAWSGRGKIPAFEEVLEFLPLWGRVTKRTDGLVEVWRGFEL